MKCKTTKKELETGDQKPEEEYDFRYGIKVMENKKIGIRRSNFGK